MINNCAIVGFDSTALNKTLYPVSDRVFLHIYQAFNNDELVRRFIIVPFRVDCKIVYDTQQKKAVW